MIRLLAPLPPAPRIEARRGRRYFRRLRCHTCHPGKYRTSRTFPVPALRGRVVRAFTDLLLHDMGPGLADGIVQGGASAREFRTAPLWGLRFSTPYLHDGRVATVEDATLAHGGEAQAARDGFAALPPAAVEALVAYPDSL